VSQDDVLFGYRLQLFDLAGRIGVSAACRTFGVHRSTYYRWKQQVGRHGLEVLRPRERRRPQMPNQLPAMVEERIVAFAIAHPGLGPRRVAAELAREKWGGIIVSANGVWRCLCRHGLNTRAKRLALVAGYRAPYEPPREPESDGHVEASRPGELVGVDCFYVGRLHGTRGVVWLDRNRRRLQLHLGRPGLLPIRCARASPDLPARLPGRPRAAHCRLAAGASAHG
jgi:transposase